MIRHLFYSLRYTKPSQLFALVQFKLIKPKPDLSPAPEVCDFTSLKKIWQKPVEKFQVLIGPVQFRFLNEEHEIHLSQSWNDPASKKLWLYNLHYFDDLNAIDSRKRTEWHHELIHRWILENPPPSGNGWEPYPLSLRIVNWIKWGLAGNRITEEMRQSLAVQTRYLMKRLEYHLPGNHLLKNGVALIFSGAFFEGAEPKKWLEQGMRIVSTEIQEQILPDGGHFERSPMYHSIVLEDLLDCVNILSSQGLQKEYSDQILELKKTAEKMLEFLSDILNPDGSIPLFNDSAYHVSAEPGELFSYADRLGIKYHQSAEGCPVMVKKDFGLYILKSKRIRLTLDCGAIGPDYLPGHAHCDTLSYELWINGQPLVVDTGTFEYSGLRRRIDRSTLSHNTVMIDRAEQHEIWKEHRVARRGYPLSPSIKEEKGKITFEGGHDGFCRLSGKPVHWRSVSLEESETLEIKDDVTGQGRHLIESFVHFHPDVELNLEKDGKGTLSLKGEKTFFEMWNFDSYQIEESFFCPEFGLKIPNKRIRMIKEGKLPLDIGVRFKG
ncbi:MAG: alginate lyase family protein [Nitrospirae bacterium]|nr:alginate lyase family protein [Nitrospirota bacterium]